MKLYWTNKCIENGYRCPKCQNMIGTKDGQMPISSKNHKIQMLDGQVKCVVCDTTVGYFAHGSLIDGGKVKIGMAAQILDTIDFVTAINQKEFK